MVKPYFNAVSLAIALFALDATMVAGQNFPTKPVRMVTSEPGGTTDALSRMLAQGISESLRQQVIVENRPSPVTAETVAKAPPDGYTLLLNANTIWMATLFQKTPYDPVRDLAPVILLGKSPNVLVVHPSLPVKSVKDLIALAKSRPGQLNYASSGAGGASHLAAELFKSKTGIDMVRITYRGNGPSVSAMMAGEVQLMFGAAGTVLPVIKAGRLKMLAISSLQPSVLFPGVPTVAASVPNFESGSIYGVFAPAKTPSAIVNRLNSEMAKLARTADARDRLLKSGIETVAGSPDELGAVVKSELAVWSKVVNDAGIRLE